MTIGSMKTKEMLATVPIPKKSRPIKTDKPRPFLCSICTRGFVRLEHLKRHKISHTNEKPYLCIFCGRCFARKDLVLRHQYKLHPSLVAKKNFENDTQSNELKSSTVRNNENILKIQGNKQTILPTPHNPLGMTAAQLKKKENETNKVRKTRRLKKNNDSKNSSKESSANPEDLRSFNGNNDKNITTTNDTNDTNTNSNKLKHEQSLQLPHSQKTRKRHASFSASNSFTYKPSNVPENDPVFKLSEEFPKDIPHQVGFSTPQISANRLLEKVYFSNMVKNNEVLDFFLDDDKNNADHNSVNAGHGSLMNNSSNPHAMIDNNNIYQSNGNPMLNHADSLSNISSLFNNLKNNSQNNHDNNMGSLEPSASFLSLANLLTTSSVGEGGYSNNDVMMSNAGKVNNSLSMSNLMEYFNQEEANKSSVALNKSHPLSNTDSLSYNSNNVGENNKLIQNRQPYNQNDLNYSVDQSVTDGSTSDKHDFSQLAGTTRSSTESYDENWLTEFLSVNSQFQNHDINNFEIPTKHFNDIGFVDQLVNNSSNASNCTSSTVSPLVIESHGISSSTSVEQTVSPKSYAKKESLEMSDSKLDSIADLEGNLYVGHHNSNLYENKNPSSSNDSSRRRGRKGSVVSHLFSSRQHDLFNEATGEYKNGFNYNSNDSLKPSLTVRNDFQTLPTVVEVVEYFDENLRALIISKNNLTSEQFPTVTELNSYVNLYKLKFHPFFPFIHLPSIKGNVEEYTLLLSLTVIGSLYAFHSSHAMLLSKVAWVHVKNTINLLRVGHDYHNIPTWVIQCMILLIFVNMFNNDLSTDQKKVIRTQVSTLAELVKVSKMNVALEMLEKPPIESDHAMEYQDNPKNLTKYMAQYDTNEQIKKNFDYFIKAQTRIRTCHTILNISTIFAAVIDIESALHSIDIKCGIPCYHSDLFECKDEFEWNRMLKNFDIKIDSKFSLIELSNGGETYVNYLNYTANGNSFLLENEKVSMKTMLSLLMSIHEKIYSERSKLAKTTKRYTLENELAWRINNRPVIEIALKNWEAMYIKNGGVFISNGKMSLESVANRPELLMIIPLYSLAEIRKCLDIRAIVVTIFSQDWKKMNRLLENKMFYCDIDSLHEATDYAMNTLNFWVESVSLFDNIRNALMKTPILSIICIFISILIISEQMTRIEDWAIAAANDSLTPSSYPLGLKSSDRVMWLKCEKILKKIEMHLLPKGYNTQTYSEFLRVQANGALDVDVLNDQEAEESMQTSTPITTTIKVIKKARLSTRCLYLGLRIMGDEPIWPVALIFAHALQSRAIYTANAQEANDACHAPPKIHNQFGTMNLETYFNSTSSISNDFSTNANYQEDTNTHQKQNNDSDGVLMF